MRMLIEFLRERWRVRQLARMAAQCREMAEDADAPTGAALLDAADNYEHAIEKILTREK